MENTNFDKNEIELISACNVDENLLIDFYKWAYPNRINLFEKNWRWINHSDFYDNKVPLVLKYKNRIIAHSGMIPISLNMCGEKQNSSWFIDIKILTEFQGQGLGSFIVKEWNKLGFESCFAFGNDKSFSILKKLGWQESFDTFLHLNFIRPFNHSKFAQKFPTLVREILNIFSISIFHLIYSKNSYSKNQYLLNKLDDISFNKFYQEYLIKNTKQNNLVSPVRDANFANWRVLNSPHKEKYYIYSANNFGAIVFFNDFQSNYIDILWVTDNKDKEEIKRMISTLGIYGIKNNFSYVRFFTSNIEISSYVKKATKSIIRHPRFAFYSSNDKVFEKLKNATMDFELIDGDAELVYI